VTDPFSTHITSDLEAAPGRADPAAHRARFAFKNYR
jgi:hypothetical protein